MPSAISKRASHKVSIVILLSIGDFPFVSTATAAEDGGGRYPRPTVTMDTRLTVANHIIN